MADNYLNLNDVGALTQSGQGYDSVADDHANESQNFRGRMDASQAGLKGNAGATFANVAELHTGNINQLATQIAQQALRAVRGERSVTDADSDADTTQSTTMSTVDALSQSVSRPINF
jgi:hypothetical protein